MAPEIRNIINGFNGIGLAELDNVRLMDRFDTKYLLPASRVPELLWLTEGKYRVLDVNGTRISSYETIYFDTPDFMFFNQHITKRNGRAKIRFRTYVTTGRTFLEIKKKTKNDRTLKWRIENSLLSGSFDDKASEFIYSHLGIKAEELKATLENHFKRITLACVDTQERITLDFDISFSEPGGNIRVLPFIAVVELKRDRMSGKSPFSEIVRQLSFYSTGFSKYCIGSAMLYDLPRKNLLKPKLLLLNRIENEYNGSLSA